MNFPEIRKAVAAGIVTVTGVAGEALSIGLVPTHDTKWVQFAIACATALGTAIAVYATPKGATLSQRVADVEKQLAVPVEAIADAAQDSPLPESVKKVAAKIETDLHAGVAASAPWPTEKVSA